MGVYFGYYEGDGIYPKQFPPEKLTLTQSQPKKTKHSQPPSPQPLTQLIALNLPLKSAVIIRLEKPQAMRRPMEAVVEPTRGGMPRIEIHDPHKLDGWVTGELEVGGQFTPFPSSPPSYIGVNGLCPLAYSLLAPVTNLYFAFVINKGNFSKKLTEVDQPWLNTLHAQSYSDTEMQALPKMFGLECALHLAAHSGMQSLFDLTIGIGEDAGEGTWGAGAVLGGLTGGGVVVGGFTGGG
ncbi:hypothetical protein CICLE_v10003108mg [Citrus x clementina]|uniref:Uncharacterized protein n=1 Tax=Citrus clementina TaxID=85681 RepID=V4SDV0_CITCL|nr:hypothetical protein CICLE_v10003108mg [Citrus x clementina]